MLTSFSLENYRAFARRQEIEIRPLTLFFGWNSGGKSALLRFLPLLAESIRVGGPPIWLAGSVGRGATWPELVSKATERNVLRFSLRWDNGSPLFAHWEIAGDLAGRWQETQALVLEANEARAVYNQETKWLGLLPNINPEDFPGVPLLTLKGQLRQLASDVQWISGLRIRPPRVATYGGGTAPTLREDGGDAVDHLIAAQLRSTADPLLLLTQKLFASLGEQLILDNPMEGAWRVLLHPTKFPQLRVNLCDTGEGYAQVLPVLVALARARTGGPRLLCLEQPELHLHTRAQAEFSNILVESARDPAQPRILVETHSEVLLVSIQLAIATGKIDPTMVKLYWVESRLDGTSDVLPADLDSKGRPTSSAIVGAFEDAVRLGQQLLERQLSS